MAFFNKKEEVIDIQFTRFGRRSLAMGEFKPAFYQFFDDDIVYNTDDNAGCGFKESQNQSQVRILNNTPRLKKNISITGLRQNNRGLASEFTIFTDPGLDGKMNYSSVEQEKILLYPLSEYESNSEESPYLQLNSFGLNLKKDEIKYLQLTGAGVYKKIPQLEVTATHTLIRTSGLDVSPEQMVRLKNSNKFIDLTAATVEFLDKSTLSVTGEKIIFSLEEANSYYNLSNFELEIYEVDETSLSEILNHPEPPELRRLKGIEDINKFFFIRTDQDVHEIKTSFGREKNWYRTGE
jgi:hypothetical protein